VRKRIEEVFGWTKAAAGFRNTHRRGLAHVGWMLTLTASAYNLVRLPKLMAVAAYRCPESAIGNVRIRGCAWIRGIGDFLSRRRVRGNWAVLVPHWGVCTICLAWLRRHYAG
jgi:hypothetical protein